MKDPGTILEELAGQREQIQAHIKDQLELLRKIQAAEKKFRSECERMKAMHLAYQRMKINFFNSHKEMSSVLQLAESTTPEAETLSRLNLLADAATEARDTVVVPDTATDSSDVVVVPESVGGLSPRASDQGQKRALTDSKDDTSVKRVHVETAGDNA